MSALDSCLVGCLALLVACSSGGSKDAPSGSAAPSSVTIVPRPPMSTRSGPSFLDDGPIPPPRPLPSVAPTPPGPPKASCDMRAKRGVCLDIYKTRPSDKSDCASPLVGGKYGNTPCPLDKSIGYCTTYDGDRRHYYDGKATEGFGSGVDDARLSCETRHFMPAK